jgi:hypothetical protein
MGAKRMFEFRIVRFVPNAVHGMTANIGVILTEVGVPDSGFADVKLTDDWSVATFFDPAVDVDVLQALASEIRESLRAMILDRSMGGVEVTRREWMEHVLVDWCSNGIQVGEPIAVVTDDPVRELNRLVKMFCIIESPTVRVTREPRKTGRAAIVIQMRQAFKQYGVMKKLEKRIDVSELTQVGNGWKIDYGYRYPTEVMVGLSREDQVYRMFHAVSLRNDADSAEILASRFQEFRERLEEKVQARAELTAIVEADLDRETRAVKFAHEILAHKNVLVKTLAQMPEIAERARRELAA